MGGDGGVCSALGQMAVHLVGVAAAACVLAILVQESRGPLLGDALSLVWAAPPGHGARLGRHRPPDRRQLRELRAWPDPATFHAEFVLQSTPFVVRGGARVGGVANVAARRWGDDAYLRERYGDEIVEVDAGNRNSKELMQRNVTLRDFLDRYRRRGVRDYLYGNLPQAMRGDVLTPPPLLCGGYRRHLVENALWMAAGDGNATVGGGDDDGDGDDAEGRNGWELPDDAQSGNTLFHHDTVENVNCLYSGRKEFVLFRSLDTDAIDCDGACLRADNRHRVDQGWLDARAFPALAAAPWFNLTLRAGDCLYLPWRWNHQVRSYGRALAVNVWFEPFRDFDFDDCAAAEEGGDGGVDDHVNGGGRLPPDAEWRRLLYAGAVGVPADEGDEQQQQPQPQPQQQQQQQQGETTFAGEGPWGGAAELGFGGWQPATAARYVGRRGDEAARAMEASHRDAWRRANDAARRRAAAGRRRLGRAAAEPPAVSLQRWLGSFRLKSELETEVNTGADRRAAEEAAAGGAWRLLTSALAALRNSVLAAAERWAPLALLVAADELFVLVVDALHNNGLTPLADAVATVLSRDGAAPPRLPPREHMSEEEAALDLRLRQASWATDDGMPPPFERVRFADVRRLWRWFGVASDAADALRMWRELLDRAHGCGAHLRLDDGDDAGGGGGGAAAAAAAAAGSDGGGSGSIGLLGDADGDDDDNEDNGWQEEYASPLRGLDDEHDPKCGGAFDVMSVALNELLGEVEAAAADGGAASGGSGGAQAQAQAAAFAAAERAVRRLQRQQPTLLGGWVTWDDYDALHHLLLAQPGDSS